MIIIEIVSRPFDYISLVEQTYGDQLKSLLRYNRYRRQETPAEWVALLGPDILSTTHPEVQ